jgi:hypothetical protein
MIGFDVTAAPTIRPMMIMHLELVHGLREERREASGWLMAVEDFNVWTGLEIRPFGLMLARDGATAGTCCCTSGHANESA